MTPEQRIAVAVVANLLLGEDLEEGPIAAYLTEILPPPDADNDSIHAALEALPKRFAGLLRPFVELAGNAVAALAEDDDPQSRAAMLADLASRVFEEGSAD